jgi:hypothetical protein
MKEIIFGDWMSHSFVARMYAWQAILILALCALLWYHTEANAAEMVSLIKPVPAKRATEWELLGKNHWKAQLDDKYSSIVTIELRGLKVTYEILSECAEGAKSKFAWLRWTYGKTVGKRHGCDGMLSHPTDLMREHEKNFGPYPDPVETVLGFQKGRFSHRI